MPPAEADPNRSKTQVPEKRQPWKDHWDALSASEPTGSGTSHGFEMGEQVIMDGNIIKDELDAGGDDEKKPDNAKEAVGDVKESADPEKEDEGKEKEKGADNQEGGGEGNGEGGGNLFTPFKMTVANQHSLVSDIHYLENHKLYETEKPYSLRFPPNGIPQLPQSNVRRDRHQIQLRSIRENTDLRLDSCGFELLLFPCALSYQDFEDRQKIRDTVKLTQAQVRRRHEAFPISTGDNYEYNQPTSMAHIDFTVREGERIIHALFGVHAGKVLQSRWQIIKQVDFLQSGVCDTRTVDFKSDTMPGDIVFRKFFTENLQVHYNAKHAWYWLPGQTVDEVLIFKSAESDVSRSQGVPHAGFYNPNVTLEDLPRESIDCRLLVCYAELENYPPIVGDIFGNDAQGY
ncbi:CMCJ-like methyltransferase [Apiospora phragmitis]|uniref:CMCJ-like methyltransferase n=1 Tax=Apiospora phragmitis TaxID=2905665 RepID=A0ABR1VD36_9PEZI